MRAQLRVGVESCLQHMGRAPRGIWLPECAYRPGLEEALANLGLGYFFTDTHVVLGAEPSEKAAGDALGLYGSALDRHIQRSPDAQAAVTGRTTMRPYRVRDSDVAVLGRDGQTGRQVWSASGGYPGDPAYREFHRKDEHSGAQYWRVTGPTVELGQKELYDPRVRAATGPGPRRSLCLPRRGRAVRVPHSLPDARNRRLCL